MWQHNYNRERKFWKFITDTQMDLVSKPMLPEDFLWKNYFYFEPRHLAFCKTFDAIARFFCRILVWISLKRCSTLCRKNWQILSSHNFLWLQILAGFQDRKREREIFKMANTAVAFCLRHIFRAKQHKSKSHKRINNICWSQFSSLGFIWTLKTSRYRLQENLSQMR